MLKADGADQVRCTGNFAGICSYPLKSAPMHPSKHHSAKALSRPAAFFARTARACDPLHSFCVYPGFRVFPERKFRKTNPMAPLFATPVSENKPNQSQFGGREGRSEKREAGVETTRFLETNRSATESRFRGATVRERSAPRGFATASSTHRSGSLAYARASEFRWRSRFRYSRPCTGGHGGPPLTRRDRGQTPS